jgi:hypothetical protein
VCHPPSSLPPPHHPCVHHLQRRRHPPTLSLSDIGEHYTPSDPEVPLASLLRIADQVVAAKPGMRDEYMRAKSEEVSLEEFLGGELTSLLNHVMSGEGGRRRG